VDLKQPDRWRGERMKVWGALLIAFAILLFLVMRYMLGKTG
jgi:uncharacterized membrane protein